jgi:hypothetical protein
MVNEIDFRNLDVDSADILKSLELKAGVLLNGPALTGTIAEMLKKETLWRVFPFESFAHTEKILERESLHVFVTHWHIGVDHDANNKVTRLVKRLKTARGGPGIGRGPFIVATVTGSADEFSPGKPFLDATYDFYFSIPLSQSKLVDMLVSRLFLVLPSRILRSDGKADPM